MAFERITEDDLQGKGNLGRPDTPAWTPPRCSAFWTSCPGRSSCPPSTGWRNSWRRSTPPPAWGAASRGPAGGHPRHGAGVLEAMQAGAAEHAARTDNPHAVTAAQTGAYTKAETEEAIGRRVVEIGAGDMAQAVYDPARLGVDVTVQTYTHTRSGTVHNFAGSGANGRALMTADVQAGTPSR